MASSLRKPMVIGVIAGALTAVAVFGGTGAFLATAQDSPDTTAQIPDTTVAPDTTQAPDTTESPDTTAPDRSAPAPSEDQQAAAEAWRQCMADHGVDIPAPALDENGRPVRPDRPKLDESQRDAFEAAIDACGPPPGRGHFGKAGPGGRHNCPGMGDQNGQTAPDQSTPSDTAPSAQGASFRV